MTQSLAGDRPLQVAVLGLGYVGAVTAGCLAKLGRTVVGVDSDPVKADAVRAGRSPVSEPGLDDLLAEGVAAGRIRVADISPAVASADVIMIAVGTPSLEDGALDLGAVIRVSREVGVELPADGRFRAVAIRSTVLPGTIEEVVRPILAASAPAGARWGVATNPEFLREGSGIRDFLEANRTIIGAEDRETAALVEQVYEGLRGPVFHVGTRTAELIKYTDNSFHALKIAFANEVASVARRFEVDGREILRLLAADDRLNLSAAYLRPGFAFGGSCLPKDLRALTDRARRSGMRLPLLDAILVSNDAHLERAVELVERHGRRSVAILGLSFKAGTDDLRESPAVALAERLLGRGYPLVIFDEDVRPDTLRGANRRFIEERLPHLGRLLAGSLDEAVAAADLIVVTKGAPGLERLPSLLRDDQQVVDLVGLPFAASLPSERYSGIGWS